MSFLSSLQIQPTWLKPEVAMDGISQTGDQSCQTHSASHPSLYWRQMVPVGTNWHPYRQCEEKTKTILVFWGCVVRFW